MVIPDWNPREFGVASQEASVGAIGGMALTVIIERVDLLIREWNAANGLSPAIVAVLVFVKVIA